MAYQCGWCGIWVSELLLRDMVKYNYKYYKYQPVQYPPVIPQGGKMTESKDMSVPNKDTCNLCGAIVSVDRADFHMRWHQDMYSQVTSLQSQLKDVLRELRHITGQPDYHNAYHNASKWVVDPNTYRSGTTYDQKAQAEIRRMQGVHSRHKSLGIPG